MKIEPISLQPTTYRSEDGKQSIVMNANLTLDGLAAKLNEVIRAFNEHIDVEQVKTAEPQDNDEKIKVAIKAMLDIMNTNPTNPENAYEVLNVVQNIARKALAQMNAPKIQMFRTTDGALYLNELAAARHQDELNQQTQKTTKTKGKKK